MTTIDLQISRDPRMSAALRDELTEVWVEVTNNGGAVGFLPPTTALEVRPLAESIFERAAAGTDHLIVACEAERVLGWVHLETNGMAIVSHWAWFKRLMVRPEAQNRRVGSSLTRAAAEFARDLGLQQLYLTCRSQTPLKGFYEALGWREVGRMPGNLRLADGSYRDEIYMLLELHPND